MLAGSDNPIESLRSQLELTAKRCFVLLDTLGLKVVFAESCTAGLVSAALGAIPGASRVHCGSAVVYRLETKTCWLGVQPKSLATCGPISETVAREMVAGVLSTTPEADWAAAITGGLGPGEPPETDGLIYVAVQSRSAAALRREAIISNHRLLTTDEERCGLEPEELRALRQVLAATIVLGQLEAVLAEAGSATPFG